MVYSVKVALFTREALALRRFRRRYQEKLGYEDVTEGGRLWELHRGYRTTHRIVDAVIGPDGKTLLAKIEMASK